MMRVLIIDDISVYRQSLADALDREPCIDAGAGAADYRSGLQVLAADPGPWVVLLNVNMTDGVSALGTIVREAPAASVIAFVVSERHDDVIACAEAGAAGYLLRGDSLQETRSSRGQ
jgi:DNA-binding NarL/FixJ family response regulator